MSERTQKGLGFSQQEKMRRILRKGYPFPMLAAEEASGKWVLICCACSLLETRKGMERKRETEHNDLLPKKGNPLNETVCYKIGGTVFEIETSCGGSELLYDKMKRLIKSETVKTPTDKVKEVRYNEDNNLFVGRSLQEE